MIKFEVKNRLRELFHYDPNTGQFTYVTRVARRVRVGDVVGSVNSEGYRHIRLGGKTYKAHRLAWLWCHGAWPQLMIDHIDGDRDNNRLSNLREASRSQNLANSTPRRRGKSLPKGVTRRGSRWVARIQKGGRPTFLGSFASVDEAILAYSRAASEIFGRYARAI